MISLASPSLSIHVLPSFLPAPSSLPPHPTLSSTLARYFSPSTRLITGAAKSTWHSSRLWMSGRTRGLIYGMSSKAPLIAMWLANAIPMLRLDLGRIHLHASALQHGSLTLVSITVHRRRFTIMQCHCDPRCSVIKLQDKVYSLLLTSTSRVPMDLPRRSFN